MICYCFFTEYNTPNNSDMPNINKSDPEILLINIKFLCVSFLLSFPASTTFNTSAPKLIMIQVEKIMMRSFILLEIASVVAIVSQKAKTAGFNVLIKKPDTANLACVPAETLMEASCTLRIFIFLKKI